MVARSAGYSSQHTSGGQEEALKDKDTSPN